MSRLYKKDNSPYWWWAGHYKRKRYRRSTKMTQKQLARKVASQWDLKLVMGDLEFLGLPNQSSHTVKDFCFHYLNFIERRGSSDNHMLIAKGVLNRFLKFLNQIELNRIDEITVKVLNDYIDHLDNAAKTKRNHLGIISRMLNLAIDEGLIVANPAAKATLPKIVPAIRHRLLEPIDLEIIFKGAGGWQSYYMFLLYTGLRAGDVALLKRENIDLKKRSIVSLVRKTRRIHEFPLADALLALVASDTALQTPLFPTLYSESERKLNDNLRKPRKYMQALLKAGGRQHATLHSFRHTFNNTLRDLGLGIEDRQILLAHSSSQMTKVYTHPNFKLALEFVNKIPSSFSTLTEETI